MKSRNGSTVWGSPASSREGLRALLFAAWLAKVIPGIRMIHAAFQNVRPDEEPVIA